MSTPLLLADNLLETVVLHPGNTLRVDAGQTGFVGALPDVAGAEPFRLADNLRDVTRWTSGVGGDYINVAVNVGGPAVANQGGTPVRVDTVVIDRGHNLPPGTVLNVQACDEGVSWYPIRSLVVPAAPGGDPRTGLARTPEGVLWTTALPCDQYDSPSAPRGRSWWRLQIAPLPNGAAPVLAGLYLGRAYQCPEYLDGPSSLDYRVNVKVLKNAVTDGGVRIKRHLRPFAELQFKATLEEEDYALLHPLVWQLLAKGQPWWVCVDVDGISALPGAAPVRLFQAPEGGVYDPTGVVNRTVDLLLEEVAPLISL